MERLLERQLISTDRAFAAYEAMETAGSRLPFDAARRRLRAIKES